MPKHLSRLTAQDQVLTANDLFDPENRPHGKVMALAETKSLVDHSTQAHIFATKAELDAFVAEQSALSEAERTVKVGDNLYITDTGVPDYWWMGEAPWISELETGVVNVTVDSALNANSNNPVQNKVVKAALDNTLKKDGSAIANAGVFNWALGKTMAGGVIAGGWGTRYSEQNLNNYTTFEYDRIDVARNQKHDFFELTGDGENKVARMKDLEGLGGGGEDLSQCTEIAIGAQAYSYCVGVAVGRGARGGEDGVGVGYQANGADNGTSVGRLTISEFNGVAVGSVADGGRSGVAVGVCAIGAYSGVAVGNGAAGSSHGVAIGINARGAEYKVAIGEEAEASDDTPIVIGSSCAAYSKAKITVSKDGVLKVGGNLVGGGGGGGFDPNVNNIAIGANSMVDADAVAVGYSTRACQNGVAIGRCAIASSETVAIGCGSSASDVYSVAVGGCASAKMCNAVAIGASASAGWRAVTMGACASGSGSMSVVVGYGANAYDAGTAIGTLASSDARGVAIGNSAMITKGTYDAGASVAIGNEARSDYSSAVAVGANSAAGDSATAVGRFSAANSQSIAVGLGASTNGPSGGGDENIAIGEGAMAYGGNSVTIGNEIGNALAKSAMLSAFNPTTGTHAFLRIIAGSTCTDTYLEFGKFDTLSGEATSVKIPMDKFSLLFTANGGVDGVTQGIVGGRSMYGYNG